VENEQTSELTCARVGGVNLYSHTDTIFGEMEYLSLSYLKLFKSVVPDGQVGIYVMGSHTPDVELYV
jgi:hypothetical protein